MFDCLQCDTSHIYVLLPVAVSLFTPPSGTPPPSDSPNVGTAVGVVVALLVVAMVTAAVAVALVFVWRRYAHVLNIQVTSSSAYRERYSWLYYSIV